MLLTDSLIDELHTFRIERMARSVAAMRERFPFADGKATGGGFVIFSGEGVPRTAAYGIGHRGASFDLAELDAFFAGRASNWDLVVTPFASRTVFDQATQLGYVPVHFRTVLAQVAEAVDVPVQPGVEIEEVTGDLDLWTRVSDAGWADRAALNDAPTELGIMMAVTPGRRYLAWVDGEPAATATLVSFGNRCFFAGACTRLSFRGRGLQSALTLRRLFDAGPGALVQVVALPGTQSHRNLQRVGFCPLYSKLILSRHSRSG
jgi:hypothetical protein